MNIQQKTGLAIGAAVIGVGGTLGAAYALAGTETATAQAQTSAAAERGAGSGRPDGGEQGGGMAGGLRALASALAEKLGVTEAEVGEALESAMAASRPTSRPSQGTQPGEGKQKPGGGDPSSRDAALATALAEALGLDDATVVEAIAEVRAEQQADEPSGTGTEVLETEAPQPTTSPSA